MQQALEKEHIEVTDKCDAMSEIADYASVARVSTMESLGGLNVVQRMMTAS